MDPCSDFNETGMEISKHLLEFYNNLEHKMETPVCVVCVAFFVGLQFGEEQHKACCPPEE